MKLTSRPALLCLVSASFPLVVACGSASSGLFSSAGGTAAAEAGSFGVGASGGAGTAHAGQSAGGTSSSTGGDASTSGGSAGQAMSGGDGNASNGGSAGTASGVAGDASSTGGGNNGGGAGAGTAGDGTAGSSAGGTSAGGTSTGGTSTGGTSAGGTSTGGTSTGGSAGAPVCPDSAPKDGDFCAAATPDNCFYPGLACSCLPDPMLQQVVRKWSCVGDGDKCPQDGVPTDTSCKGMAGTICPYSAKDFCACVAGVGGNEARWQCTGGTVQTCSPTMPSGFCGAVRECAYPGPRECLCGGIGSNWQCQ